MTNPGNAGNGSASDNDYATLAASHLSLLVTEYAGEAWVQMKFPATVPAGRTTFVRIDKPTAAGLNLSVLDLLNLADSAIRVTAYAGASASDTGSAVNGNNPVDTHVITDLSGNYYLAVTPSVAYNSVRVYLRLKSGTLSLSLGSTLQMNVYNAFYDDADPADCGQGLATDEGTVTGVNLNLNSLLDGLGLHLGDIVTNPTNAIDADVNSASVVSPGLLGVANTTSQTIFFNGPSLSTDAVRVIMSFPASLLQADIINNITLQAYNGSTPVGAPQSVKSLLLSLDLLGLLSSDTKIPVTITPGGVFDRIKISFGTIVGAGGSILNGGVSVYDVHRVPGAPQGISVNGTATDSIAICSDSTVTLNVVNPLSGVTYKWYNQAAGGTQIGTGNSYQIAAGSLSLGVHKLSVLAEKNGCPGDTSDRKVITVNIIQAQAPTTDPQNDTTICLGQTVTLRASSTQSGATFNWYTQATGGTPLRTGQDTIHVSPTDTTTYYAETVLGSCTSATRTAITINVLPIPASPVVVPDTVYVSLGQTATFHVVAPEKNTTYKWYTTSTGGTAIHTDSVFTTPAITANVTRYYVEATNSNGCASSARTMVVVISSQAPNNIACNYANAQQSPVFTGGYIQLCVLCDVFNPDNAIDGDTTTASNIRANVGLGLGGKEYIGQLLRFQHDGKAGDSVRFILGSNSGLLDAGLLGNVQIQFYQGANPVGSATLLNNALLHLQLLQGATKSYATIIAPVDYDGVLISLGGTLTALTTLNLYNAEQLVPPAVPVSDTVNICQGNSANLSVTAPAGVDIKWYSQPIGGTSLQTGDSYTTPVLNDTTTYYVESSRDGCANPQRIPVVVNVSPPLPAPPVNADTVKICAGGTATFEVRSPQAGVSYIWYNAATGGTALDTAATFTTPVLTSDATYYVEAVNGGGCAGTGRTKVTADVVPVPASPVVVPDTAYISLGQTATFHVVAPEANTVYKWYTTSTGGTAIYTDTVFTTPTITASVTKYYVEASNGNGCTNSTRTMVVVISSQAPTNIACNYANAQESPVFTGGFIQLCVLCNVFNPDNAIDGDTTTASNIRANVGLGLGGKEYIGQLLRFQHNGKAGDSVRFILGSNSGLLDAGLLGNVQIQFYQGANPVGSATLLNNALLHLQLLQGATKSYATVVAPVDYDGVLVSLGGTLTALTTLNLYNAEQLVPLATPSSDTVDICQGNSANLSVTAPAGVDIKWYSQPIGGTPLQAGNSFTTPALNDTTIYYVESSRDGCANPQRVPVVVNVSPQLPAPPVNADSVKICAGSTATFGVKNPQAGVSYIWYNAAVGGTALDTAATFTTPVLTSNATYYVEAVGGGGCAGTGRTTVHAIVGDTAAAPVLAADTIYATSGEVVTFYVTDSSNATISYRWYDAATNGNLLHTGYSFTTPALSATTVYYVEAVSTSGCVSSVRTKAVAIIAPPTTPDCGYPNAQQSPIYDGLLGGLLSLGNVNNPLLAIDNSETTASQIYSVANVAAYIGQQLSFPATSEKGDTLHLVLGLPTGLADASVLGHIRVRTFLNNTQQEEFTLNPSSSLIRLALLGSTPGKFEANIPVTKSYNKILISLGGVLTAVTALDVYSARQEVAIPVLEADSVGICSGEKATLKATTTSQDADIKWYASATGGTALATGTTFTTPALTTTTTYYAEASRNGCANPQRVAATVFVGTPPSIPAVVPKDSVCVGESAVLKVIDPVDTLTYRWYSVATGGTVLATDTVFTTPALSTNTTYYVEAVNGGGCVSASRAAVDVVVNPVPAAPGVIPTSSSVPSGNTVTFNVQSPNSNYTYNWYGVANGGAPIFTGTSFTTPPLYTSTSFYVEAVNATGCASSARTKVDVSVTGFPDVPCSFANAQETYNPGLISIATILKADSAIDEDVNTASQIKVFVNVAAGFGQKLIFPFQGHAGDSVHIKISADPGQLLSLSVLGGTHVRTFNGATDNNDGTDVNNTSLVKLDLLNSGGNAGLISFKATKDFNAVALYQTDLLNATIFSDGLRVYYASASVPTPELAADSVTICQGDSTTLTVQNPAADATYKWYTSAVGGTSIGSGASITVKPGSTTIYYVEASRAGSDCPNPYRVGATVVVRPAPAKPDVVSNDVTICAGNTATLEVKTPQTGVTYRWYASATGGTVLHSGVQYTTSPLNKDTAYYVEAQVDSSNCISLDRTLVQVHVTPLPAAPALNVTSTTLCSGDSITLQVKNPVTGVTYKWYTASTGGTAVFTGTTFTTPALTSNAAYYVEAQTSGGCMSTSRTGVAITVNALPAVPQLTADTVAVCYGATATLQIKSPVTGTSYRWYLSPAGGSILHTGTSYTTPALTSDATFYVQSVSASGCVSDSIVAAHVKIIPLPTVTVNSSEVSICSGEKATLSVKNPATGVTYKWYGDAGGTTVLATGSTYTTDALTTSKIYYVEATNGSGCVSAARDSVKVTVNPLPAAPTVNATDITVCSGESASLSVKNPVTGVIYKWYSAATGGTALATGADFTTGALTTTTTYYVEASNPTGCTSSSRTAVKVTVNPLPAAPEVTTASVTICAGNTATLSVKNPKAGYHYQWYRTATGDTSLFTGISFETPVLTSSVNYYVEAISDKGCTSAARTLVSVTVNALPSLPDVKATDITICSGSSATLEVNNPAAGAVYRWYDAAQGGTLAHTGVQFMTPALTKDTAFYVEASSTATGCASSSRTKVTVTVVPLPAAPTVEATDVSICSGSSATLKIQSPQTGLIYKWYSTATGGTALASGTDYTTATLTASAVYYVEAVNATGCMSSSRTKVTVTVVALPAAPSVEATNVSICSGNTATLKIQSPQAGLTYKWYSTATGGAALATGTSYTTVVLTSDAAYYVEAVNATGCMSSSRTEVTVTVIPLPVAPEVEATDISICSGSTATLKVQSPQAGLTYKWYSTATGGTALTTGATYTTAALTSTAVYYVEADNAGGCVSSSRTKVTVTVVPLPAAPLVEATDVSVCSGSTATLKVQSPQVGVTYKWYSTATGGTALASGTDYTTGALTANAAYYVEATNGTGCTSTARTEVDVTVNALPATPALVNDAMETCAGGSVTFEIQNPQTGYTYHWYDAATGGTELATGSTFTTPALTTDKTYYVEAVNAGGCMSSSRAMATVTVHPAPDAPSVKAASIDICMGNSATLEISGPQAGITYHWYTAASGGTAVATGTSYMTGALNATTVYYVEATNASDCSSPARTKVTVNVTPLPDAPTVEATDVTVCTGKSATLTVTNPQAGVTYKWYVVSAGGTPVATGESFTTPALTSDQTYYVEATTGTGCSSTSRTTVQVKVVVSPAAPDVQVTSDNICPGTTATLEASSTETGVTFNWYTTATGGAPVATGASFTTPELTANTTYYVEAVSEAGGCTSSSRFSVTVHVLSKLAAPSVRVDSTTASSVTFTWDPVPDATSYEVSTDNGATFEQPSSGANGTSHTVSGLGPNEEVTLVVRAKGATDCVTSDFSNAVTGKTKNPLGDEIFVPNAFSPNGDGNNDVLFVYGNTIQTMKLVIYNQYGQKVFESRDQHTGWDGTMNGRMQPVGVYVYYLEATLQDGKKVNKKGSITLIR